MSPRVLQVLGRSAGGIARHVSQLVGELHGVDGFSIDVAGPPDLPIEIPRLRHEVLIPDGPVRGHRAAMRRLREVIERGGYDVVHAHGLRAGVDAGRAARRAARPALLTVHNVVHPAVAGRLRWRVYALAEILAVRSSDTVFAVSEEIATRLRRRVPRRAADIEVLYLGVGDPPSVARRRAEVRADLSLGPDQKLVVTVARLAPQKSLPVMLRALQRVPPHHLAVLGEGPHGAELRSLAGRLGLSDRVSFLGFRDDVHDYMAAADVFCLSSVWEGVPLAAQEAILLGVPIVATAVGGLPELVEDGVSGRLVPPSDPEALASALSDVLGSPAAAQTYAHAAREGLRARFSTAAMLERLRAAYRVGTGLRGRAGEDGGG